MEARLQRRVQRYGGHFEPIELHRITATLTYTDADEACNAAFVGGPVALAWSR